MNGPLPVLGMHRSGTSTVSKALGIAGAPIPRGAGPGRRRNPANPEGFYEVPSISRLNEEVLRALGGDWTAPPRLEPGWTTDPRLADLRRTGDRLARRHLGQPGVVWKDPRLCLTLPFWDAVVDPAGPVVVVVRNPLEIAQSIQARNGIDVPVGVALWERYVRSALALAAARPALVLRYEDLLQDPVAATTTARRWLRSIGIGPVEEPDLSAAQAFVRQSLRQQRRDETDVAGHPDVTDAQRVLYSALLASTGPHDRFAPPELPPPASASIRLLDERRAQRNRRTAAPWPRRARRRIMRTVSGMARWRRGGRA